MNNAILAWMIDGALAWQRECTVPDDEATTQELFQSWKEWANRNNEYCGSMKRFSEALKTRKLARWQDPATRRMGFVGLRVDDRQDLYVTL